MPLRRSLACVVTLALAALAPGRDAAAAPGKKTADAPYPAEFQSRVRKAIERGVTYLRTKQMEDLSPGLPPAVMATLDGVEYEEAAAVTWVLRRAGVEADDATLLKARKRLERRPPKGLDEASLLLLALCAQPLPHGNPFAIEASAASPSTPVSLPKEDRALVETTVKFVLGRQVKGEALAKGTVRDMFDGGGGWGFEIKDRNGSDIPSTYMALLGLEAAARVGVAVPSSTYLAALELLVGWQAPEGHPVRLAMNEVRGTDRFEWIEKAKARGFGWCGSACDSPSGYETVGGALGLVICQDALQKQRGFTRALQKAAREGIRDALAWVQEHYDISKNPSTGADKGMIELDGWLYLHHWLQGLARLALHARMRLLGTHDWYQEGAEVLLKAQGPDGGWDIIWWHNCYALLFLLRASLPSIVPVVTVSEQDPGR